MAAETAWERALDRRRRQRLGGLGRDPRSEEPVDEHAGPPEAADRG